MTKRNVVHIEIPVSPGQESGQFFQDLFGWKMESYPEMNYTTWEAPEGPGGGFSPLSDDVKPGDVLIYIDSDDIEADLQKVETLGGQIVSHKTEIPGIGWFGLFKDPTGNMLALYTSMNPEYNQ